MPSKLVKSGINVALKSAEHTNFMSVTTYVNRLCWLILLYIHSKQICPNIVISNVAMETAFETSTSRAKTRSSAGTSCQLGLGCLQSPAFPIWVTRWDPVCWSFFSLQLWQCSFWTSLVSGPGCQLWRVLKWFNTTDVQPLDPVAARDGWWARKSAAGVVRLAMAGVSHIL